MAGVCGLEHGHWGERLAEAVLAACGYTCLDRRWRAPRGELDLVARRGDALVFVEVKARREDGAGPPECFIDARKRHRVRQAARAWLAAHPEQRGARLRFDVVAIAHRGTVGGVDIRHLVDAF